MSRRNTSPRIKAVRPGAGVSKDPGLNPDQLKMLMTGSELMRTINYSADAEYYGETIPDMWERKESESRSPIIAGIKPEYQRHGAGVYQSIKQKGYEGEPINLVLSNYEDPVRGQVKSSQVWDGHHRIAAAAALEKEGNQVYIPVEHTLTDEPELEWWEL